MRLQTFVFVIAATHRLNEVYTAERKRVVLLQWKELKCVHPDRTLFYHCYVFPIPYVFFVFFLGNTKTGYFKNHCATLFRTMAVHRDRVCSQQNLLTLIPNLYAFPFSAEQKVRYFNCWGPRKTNKQKNHIVCVKSNT